MILLLSIAIANSVPIFAAEKGLVTNMHGQHSKGQGFYLSLKPVNGS